MSGDSKTMPLRQGTTFSDETAVPELDPTTTAGLLAERLQAWKHAVGYLEDYVSATEKVHKAHAKEYERVLKTISSPLKEGAHFDQTLGGVAGLFENMRSNTQHIINSNSETEKTLKGTVLPILERLHKEIKAKHKEVTSGVEKGAKEIEKARNTTQKQIELLGQQAAAFEATGGKLTANDDPYVLQRGVIFRLNKQVIEENNHRNDLINVQDMFQGFEAHVIQTVQTAIEALNQVAGGQAGKTQALYSDMLSVAQRVPGDYEWKAFVNREGHRLVDPNTAPRSADAINFANQNHTSTQPLIEGSLERKSRNKLSWGVQTGYYVVTPSKFLHEFKDDDNYRQDPKPEMSIYLPEATISETSGEKFVVKGKDKGKSFSSKLAGTSELNFKAHSAAEAQKWFESIKLAASASGGSYESPQSTMIGGSRSSSVAHTTASGDKAQEAGITGDDTVNSPTVMSPTGDKAGFFKDEKAADEKAEADAKPVAEKSASTDEKKVEAEKAEEKKEEKKEEAAAA